MKQPDDFMQRMLLHIKYPYTALILATIWIGMAVIISLQQTNFDVLIALTAGVSIIIALIGFSPAK